MVDATGGEHTISERGALVLSSEGRCRLRLAVSVDGDEPGVSDRSCTWETVGDLFFLGDGRDGARTAYRIRRAGERIILEGLKDLAASCAPPVRCTRRRTAGRKSCRRPSCNRRGGLRRKAQRRPLREDRQTAGG